MVLEKVQRKKQPSPGLVKALSHEVSRKVLFKDFNILKRIMNICIWHRPTLKPAVKYLKDAKNHIFITSRK